MTTSTRLALVGSNGRMGRRIDRLACAGSEVEVTMRVGRSDRPTGSDDAFDVVVDFSTPEGTKVAIDLARRSGRPLLVGTTGLSDGLQEALETVSRSVAVLIAPNTSLGVALLRKLARLCAETLGGVDGWSVDLVESHHDRKKDAPSGTALALAGALEAGGMPIEADRIHAIRAGDTVGEHEVRFAGPGERLHLVHQAVTRDLFAEGAIRAARWLHGRAPGLYAMDDVLG